MYINFKLKVAEASALGYDTVASFKNELEGYREQLSEPYTRDPEIMDMLVREAYGVINSQFAFDQVGQVTITMSLWTKGVSELRTMSINNDGSLRAINDLKALAKQINVHLGALGVQPAEGINKEIRSQMVLEAASRGSYPDLTKDQITKAIADLKASFRSPDPKIDKATVQVIIDELGKLDKSYLDYKQTIDSQVTEITNKLMGEVAVGIDPFLPFSAKNVKVESDSKQPPHPFTELIESYNKNSGEAKVADQKGPMSKVTPGFRKKLVSFGKLLSVFFANTFKQVDGFDELQLYFYQLNEHAGKAAGTNLAEFPIEMSIFLDQYREHVERKGSEFVTLEEFLQLAVDAQLSDPRSLAYGFKKYYAAYDPAHKHDVGLATGITPEDLMAKQGKFQMPVITMFIETTFAARPKEGEPGNKAGVDLLHQFELSPPSAGATNGGRSNQYVRIMRVHIFDKTNNPYKLPAKILQSSDGSGFILKDDEEKKGEQVKSFGSDLFKTASEFGQIIIKQLLPDGRLDPNADNKISNDEIKHFVSKMVPTIVYGGNASSIISANLASKQDPLLATTQMQTMAKKNGKPSVISTNGSDVGGLPLRIIPASMTMTTLGCPLLSYAQIFFIDFNTGTTIDGLYNLTGITHTITPGKFESQMTLTFADAYGQFFGAPSITDYFKSLKVP